MANIHKGQRVAVFVDVQNLYYTARNIYGKHVNYSTLLRKAVDGRILVRALSYVIRTEEVDKEAFFEAIANIGFEIKSKDLQIFGGGAKKGDWDVGLAVDAIQLAPKVDTIILASGDGDYVPLVEHLQKAMGCRVEVMSFGKSTSAKLIEAADHFIDMDKESHYLMERAARKS
ncbi:NYN domain-containing protein [Candidatus Woesearchaeota archaeon]|nr:NYN domain-containing protein [Candidatus Woesearchaeota archaeon]